MKNILNRFLIMTLLGVPLTSLASENDNLQNKNNVKKEEVSKIENHIKFQLDASLKKQDYITFFDLINKYKENPDLQIEYLSTKKSEAHVPVFWLLADAYARKNSDYETHKWLYIALVTTKQDSELCHDKTAHNSSAMLMKAFPKTEEVSRRSPHNIKPVMNEVVFFLNNLRVRQNPSWVCQYGSQKLSYNSNILIHESLWDNSRRRILSDFLKNFNN